MAAGQERSDACQRSGKLTGGEVRTLGVTTVVEHDAPEAEQTDISDTEGVTAGEIEIEEATGSVERIAGLTGEDDHRAKYEMDMKFMTDVVAKFKKNYGIACWSQACGEAGKGCAMAVDTRPKWVDRSKPQTRGKVRRTVCRKSKGFTLVVAALFAQRRLDVLQGKVVERREGVEEGEGGIYWKVRQRGRRGGKLRQTSRRWRQ